MCVSVWLRDVFAFVCASWLAHKSADGGQRSRLGGLQWSISNHMRLCKVVQFPPCTGHTSSAGSITGCDRTVPSLHKVVLFLFVCLGNFVWFVL